MISSRALRLGPLAAGALAFCLMFAPAALGAAFSRSNVGTTTGQFLKFSPTARGSAMGEAMTALADDASALYWNPAGLVDVTSNSVVFTHTSYLADSFYDYAAYAHNFGETGSMGVSVQYMNYGAITRTDTSGVDVGEFTPYDVAVSLGFASYISGFNKYPWERFALGVSAKMISSKITQEDHTITADAGIISPWFLYRRLRFGLGMSNALGALKYDEDSFNLPFTLKAGVLLRPVEWLDLSCDAVAPIDNAAYFAAGIEIRRQVIEKLRVDLRAGYNNRAATDYSGFRNASFGIGLAGGALSCDYALSPFGELGDAHRLTFKFGF